MSKFYVGQRVRIVYSRRRPDWIGKEATISEVEPDCEWIDGSEGTGYLLSDFSTGRGFFWGEEQLEPITNPGQLTSITEIQKMPSADWSILAPGVVA